MDLENLKNESVARRCVTAVLKYWHSLGYDSIKCEMNNVNGVFVVTSNLGPTGYPPG